MNISTFYQKTIRELDEAGSQSPELDAKVIIESVIGKDQTFLLAHPLEPITNSQYSKLRHYIKRRKNGEPIAYITGHKEFFGLDFIVNKNVLVPRPETEFLVERALEHIKHHMSKDSILKSTFNIADIGTGSGCIIISLAKKLDKLYNFITFNFHASDISPKALATSKKNALTHGVKDKIKFIHSNLFSNRLLHKRFDLIIANLPYVPPKIGSGNKEDIDFEPISAIFADDNGASIIKSFLNQSKNYINKKCLILVELDPRNAIEIKEYAEKLYPEAKIELEKDLANFDRYLIIEN